jgi:hypothetical protein
MTDPLIERIARAWLHHLGYSDAVIDSGRELLLQPNPHLYFGCEPDGAGAYTDCTREDGTSRHPEIDAIGDASVYAYVVVEALGLTAEVESYPIPGSSRRRWVTSWERIEDGGVSG